ncbi:MAG: GNAT family N-acetyltransferase [Chitinophagales bacterium]
MKVIFETERLWLAEAALTDSAFFYELLNTPKWIEFIGNRHVNSIGLAEKYVKNHILPSYANHGFGFYKMVLKTTNVTIGICGLVKRPNLENVDIGFALLPKYERKGLMYEAAQATLSYAKTELKLSKVVAITVTENQASRNLLVKIGLHQAGTVLFGKETLLLYST